jgi:hypothetical protein
MPFLTLSVWPAKPSRILTCFWTRNISTHLYVCSRFQDQSTYQYSADKQHRTVNQTNILLSVLQVLLALVALACVVLAEPQYVGFYPPVSRPRNPGLGRFSLPFNPTVSIVNNRQRLRPGPVRNAVRPNPFAPAVQPAVPLPPAIRPAIPPPGTMPDPAVIATFGWATPQNPWRTLQWPWLIADFCCVPYIEEM